MERESFDSGRCVHIKKEKKLRLYGTFTKMIYNTEVIRICFMTRDKRANNAFDWSFCKVFFSFSDSIKKKEKLKLNTLCRACNTYKKRESDYCSTFHSVTHTYTYSHTHDYTIIYNPKDTRRRNGNFIYTIVLLSSFHHCQSFLCDQHTGARELTSITKSSITILKSISTNDFKRIHSKYSNNIINE